MDSTPTIVWMRGGKGQGESLFHCSVVSTAQIRNLEVALLGAPKLQPVKFRADMEKERMLNAQNVSTHVTCLPSYLKACVDN